MRWQGQVLAWAAVAVAAAVAVGALGAPARAQSPALTAASAEAGRAGPSCEPGAQGCFLDPSGDWRREDHAYRLMIGDRDPDYVRTFVESTALVAIGTAWYYIEYEDNRADWDYDSWLQRFDKDAFRYDNNDFPMNFVFHPMSGTLYYGLARVNELSVFGAATTSFLGSWAWEFLLEFRERISINDTLVTPGAGVVFGEFFHKLGLYLGGAPGGGAAKHRALRWSAGFPLAVHQALDDEGPPPAGAPADERGFDADIAARFRLSYGPTLARPAGGVDFVQHELAFDGTLAALPGYLRPGRFSRFFKDANLTHLGFRARLAAEGTGVELRGDTVLLGLHEQSIAESAGGLRGAAVTFGTSIAYLYRRDEYEDFTDLLGLMGLPGLALDGHFFLGPASLHLRGRLHGEFAGVHSAAFPAWQQAHPDERAKSILRKQGYYYGWGGSGRLEAELRLPYLELGGSVRYGLWDSREGLDRSQAEVTADVQARDRALEWGAWARFVPSREVGLFLEGAYDGQRRRSWVEGFSATQRLERWQVSVGLLR